MKAIMKTALAAAMLSTVASMPAFAGEAEEAVVKEYIEVVVNGRQFDRIDEFVAEDLIQRNPNLPNGREALQEFWTQFMGGQPDAKFTVARMISEDDLVVKHSLFQSGPDDRGTAVMDIFRVEDGMIVEHWDVIQPIPETFASGNHPVLDQ